MGLDSLKTRREMSVGGKTYDYYSLPAAAEHLGDISGLPFSLKVLLENLLRLKNGLGRANFSFFQYFLHLIF